MLMTAKLEQSDRVATPNKPLFRGDRAAVWTAATWRHFLERDLPRYGESR
jgi:hypothetical protein